MGHDVPRVREGDHAVVVADGEAAVGEEDGEPRVPAHHAVPVLEHQPPALRGAEGGQGRRQRLRVRRDMVGGCVRREGASDATPGTVRQAVGGGCQSGWGAVTVGCKCH